MRGNNKIALCLLFVASGLVGFVSSGNSATNLALGKPYTVFPLPNYRLTAPATDNTALTDGVYSPPGILWTHKTTVGWQDTRMVRILIDLKKVSVIDGITFSSAKGNFGDVNYPNKIGAFVGPDQDHLLYVGDVASGVDHQQVKYEAKRFTLHNVGTKGRYVLLDIELKGFYLFCDEIEVLEGGPDKGRTGKLGVEEAPRLNVDRAILHGLVEQFRTQCYGQPQYSSRLTKIEQRISAADASLDETRAIETDLLKLRGEVLSARFPGKAYLIEAVTPWGKFSPVSAPSGVPLAGISLSLPQGGYDHASLVITNVFSDVQKVSLALDAIAAEAPALSLYQASFVQSAAMEYVPDPLVPIQGSFTIISGESKMIFVTAKGNNPGTWRNRLKVVCGATELLIPVAIHVAKAALPKRYSLNSVTWNYLDFKPTQDRKAAAMTDLFAHHSYVAVIPSWYLALTDPGASDFIRLNQAFEQQKGADKVLLMMGYREDWIRTSRGKYEFMSDRWKEWFRLWYDGVVKAAFAAGFTQKQIYLYPYDEMAGKEIDQFISFAAWIRREIPGIRLYATLGNKGSEKALPYLDIAQVVNIDKTPVNFHSSNAELWLYDAKGPAKSLSPYSYYRMMSWKAYFYGYKGVGFWAYADTGWNDSPSSAWDDFDGKYPDFAVIYEGKGNTIISSRRWEAWRMGIEDYELLTMYARAKGENAAKALAKMVLDHPEETAMADEVRRTILTELSENK